MRYARQGQITCLLLSIEDIATLCLAVCQIWAKTETYIYMEGLKDNIKLILVVLNIAKLENT
jgi:hypothetical protein